MKIILLCFFIFYFSFICNAQGSDFFVVKKNQHTVKTFFAGSPIQFETNTGYYGGQIESVKNDSLFLLQYDIRNVPTRLGVIVLDTVATYRLQFNYKDVIAIVNKQQKGFDIRSSGASLLGGGLLLTTVGLGTWIFTKPGSQYYASPYLVAGSAILAGAGYVLLKTNTGNYKIGKKYTIEYIRIRK